MIEVPVSLEKGTISYQYVWLDGARTLFVIAPFPANAGGINSDEKINKICLSIVGLCKERLSENWLGDYALKELDQVLLPDSQLVNKHACLIKLNSEIVQYKEGMNGICTGLENLKTTLKSLSESTEHSSEWLPFDERINEMRDDVLSQLKKLDDMKALVEKQIKEVDTKLWSNLEK